MRKTSLLAALLVASLLPAVAGAAPKPKKEKNSADLTLVSPDDALPDSFRGEIVYQGVYRGQVVTPGRMRELSLQSALNAAANTRTDAMAGDYTVTIKFEGTRVSGSSSTRNGLSGSRARLDPGNFFGTRVGATCRLNWNDGSQTVNYCGRSEFRENVDQTQANGQRVTYEVQAPATRVTDAAERERQLAAEAAERARQAAERERQAAERAAFIASRPRASAAQTSALDRAVTQDSGAWISNRYDAGSMSNVRVMSAGATTRLRGEYTYNGGAKGWVEANVVGGKVQCLEFWDASGCSGVRSGASSGGGARGRGPVIATVDVLGTKWYHGFREAEYQALMGNIRKKSGSIVEYDQLSFLRKGDITFISIYRYSVDCASHQKYTIASSSIIDEASALPSKLSLRSDEGEVKGYDEASNGAALIRKACTQSGLRAVNAEAERAAFFDE